MTNMASKYCLTIGRWRCNRKLDTQNLRGDGSLKPGLVSLKPGFVFAKRVMAAEIAQMDHGFCGARQACACKPAYLAGKYPVHLCRERAANGVLVGAAESAVCCEVLVAGRRVCTVSASCKTAEKIPSCGDGNRDAEQ